MYKSYLDSYSQNNKMPFEFINTYCTIIETLCAKRHLYDNNTFTIYKMYKYGRQMHIKNNAINYIGNRVQ